MADKLLDFAVKLTSTTMGVANRLSALSLALQRKPDPAVYSLESLKATVLGLHTSISRLSDLSYGVLPGAIIGVRPDVAREVEKSRQSVDQINTIILNSVGLFKQPPVVTPYKAKKRIKKDLGGGRFEWVFEEVEEARDLYPGPPHYGSKWDALEMQRRRQAENAKAQREAEAGQPHIPLGPAPSELSKEELLAIARGEHIHYTPSGKPVPSTGVSPAQKAIGEINELLKRQMQAIERLLKDTTDEIIKKQGRAKSPEDLHAQLLRVHGLTQRQYDQKLKEVREENARYYEALEKRIAAEEARPDLREPVSIMKGHTLKDELEIKASAEQERKLWQDAKESGQKLLQQLEQHERTFEWEVEWANKPVAEINDYKAKLLEEIKQLKVKVEIQEKKEKEIKDWQANLAKSKQEWEDKTRKELLAYRAEEVKALAAQHGLTIEQVEKAYPFDLEKALQERIAENEWLYKYILPKVNQAKRAYYAAHPKSTRKPRRDEVSGRIMSIVKDALRERRAQIKKGIAPTDGLTEREFALRLIDKLKAESKTANELLKESIKITDNFTEGNELFVKFLSLHGYSTTDEKAIIHWKKFYKKHQKLGAETWDKQWWVLIRKALEALESKKKSGKAPTVTVAHLPPVVPSGKLTPEETEEFNKLSPMVYGGTATPEERRRWDFLVGQTAVLGGAAGGGRRTPPPTGGGDVVGSGGEEDPERAQNDEGAWRAARSTFNQGGAATPEPDEVKPTAVLAQLKEAVTWMKENLEKVLGPEPASGLVEGNPKLVASLEKLSANIEKMVALNENPVDPSDQSINWAGVSDLITETGNLIRSVREDLRSLSSTKEASGRLSSEITSPSPPRRPITPERMSELAGLVNTDYNRFLQQPEWKETAAAVKHRDHNQCTLCGSKKDLVAHHGSNEAYRDPLNIEYIKTLCNECHSRTHGIDPATNKRYLDDRLRTVQGKPTRDYDPANHPVLLQKQVIELKEANQRLEEQLAGGAPSFPTPTGGGGGTKPDIVTFDDVVSGLTEESVGAGEPGEKTPCDECALLIEMRDLIKEIRDKIGAGVPSPPSPPPAPPGPGGPIDFSPVVDAIRDLEATLVGSHGGLSAHLSQIVTNTDTISSTLLSLESTILGIGGGITFELTRIQLLLMSMLATGGGGGGGGNPVDCCPDIIRLLTGIDAKLHGIRHHLDTLQMMALLSYTPGLTPNPGGGGGGGGSGGGGRSPLYNLLMAGNMAGATNLLNTSTRQQGAGHILGATSDFLGDFGFPNLSAKVGKAALAMRAISGDPRAVAELIHQQIQDMVDKAKAAVGHVGGAWKSESFGAVGGHMFGAVEKGIQTMVPGEVGEVLAAPLTFGRLLLNAVDALRSFNAQLLQSDFRFAEYSGPMARVKALTEVGDIMLSKQRGDRRAGHAEVLAQSIGRLEKAIAPWEDKWAAIKDSTMAVVANYATEGIELLTDIAEKLGIQIRDDSDADELGTFLDEASVRRDWASVYGRPRRFSTDDREIRD